MRAFIKHGVAVVFFIVFLLVFLYYYGKNLQTNTLPQTDGEINGLSVSANVIISRDSTGLPGIFAGDEEDAWYSLGFLHAQERFFQMDMIRRAAEGRLSEILGSSTLQYDKLFRTLRIKKLAEINLANADETTRYVLNAYTRGVNDYLRKSEGHLPPEINILGYKPEQWKPVNSLEIIKMMAWELNMGWWEDIAFTALVAKVGEDKAFELIPGAGKKSAETDVALSPAIGDLKLFADVNTSYRNFAGLRAGSGGSNNWAVTHSKSVSGKAIIANDPHLALQIPGKWVFVTMQWPGKNLAGFTLPGIPAVVIGTNGKTAWTMTNLMNDEVDFYREKQDTSGTKYLYEGAYRDFSITSEKIIVKDSIPVNLTIKETHRGPVITGIHLFGSVDKNIFTEKELISMQWSAAKPNNDFLAFYNLTRADNVHEGMHAVQGFSAPAQNFVFADAQNNIAYTAGGLIARRKGSHPYLVHDGTNDYNDWNGFVDKDELPQSVNPEEDFLATANNPPSSAGYYISNLWEPGSRISRIRELLKGKDKHSVTDFMSYQNDITSPLAREIVPVILKSFKDIKITDNNLKTALELLEKWDYDFDKYKQAPAIYSVFITTFLQNLLTDDLGADLTNHLFFIANVPYRILENYLLKEKTYFYDDITTAQLETKDDLIRNSFAETLTALEKQFGTDAAVWQWGRLHTLTFRHLFSGASGLLDHLFDSGPFEIDGDGTTLNNTEYHFFNYENATGLFNTRPFENVVGPSMRMIYDFASPGVMYISLPNGSSGNAFSPFYKNMTSDWLRGKYTQVNLNRSPEMGLHKLTLKK